MNRRLVLVGRGLAVVAGSGAVAAGILGMGSMSDYKESLSQTHAALAENPVLGDYIRLATLSANSHNTQPWSFHIAANQIAIRPDYSRRTIVVDPADHHLFVSLGCAAENLSLAAAAGGHAGELNFDNTENGGLLFDFREGSEIVSPLFGAVTQRQSTRNIYDGRAVSEADLVTLSEVAKVSEVDLVILSDRPMIDRLRAIVLAANTVQMSDVAYLREL